MKQLADTFNSPKTLAAVVGGVVAAWPNKQNNHELFNTVDFSAPDLMHQTEQCCLTNATGIFSADAANTAHAHAGARIILASREGFHP